MITLEIPFDYKVHCYLQVNELDGLQPDDYLIVYDQEDGTPSISDWNVEKLGELPSAEALEDAFTQVENNKIAYGNKYMAQAKLAETDWTQYADVNDTSKTPHLMNKSEFDTYRLALRAIVVSPSSVVEFPTPPSALWST